MEQMTNLNPTPNPAPKAPIINPQLAPKMPVLQKKHHYLVKILIALVVIIILLFIWANIKPNSLNDQQKSELLQQFNETNNIVVTEEQKANIVNDLSAGNSGPGLSDQEKQRILDSLK